MGYQFTSAGKHLPRGIEMRVVNDEGEAVSANNIGQIHLRGPIVFTKYHNNESATSECKTKDGWFNTGDLGYKDANGQLVISGRRKEVLILNGYVGPWHDPILEN
jgi:long-subunit acyl-CoA synthetase (AMP-forming)